MDGENKEETPMKNPSGNDVPGKISEKRSPRCSDGNDESLPVSTPPSALFEEEASLEDYHQPRPLGSEPLTSLHDRALVSENEGLDVKHSLAPGGDPALSTELSSQSRNDSFRRLSELGANEVGAEILDDSETQSMESDPSSADAIWRRMQEVNLQLQEGQAALKTVKEQADKRVAEADGRAAIAEERMQQMAARCDELTKLMQEGRAHKKLADDLEKKLAGAEKRVDIAGKRCEQLITQLEESKVAITQEQARSKEEAKVAGEKYEALEAKLGRLHARAKEKVQGLQQEKEEIQEKLSKESERAAVLQSRHASMQKEAEENKAFVKEATEKAKQSSQLEAKMLEEIARARAQAAEALRAAATNKAAVQKDLEQVKASEAELKKIVVEKERELKEARDAMAETAKKQAEGELAKALEAKEKQHAKDVAEIQQRLQTAISTYEAQLDEAVAARDKALASAAQLQTALDAKSSELAGVRGAKETEVAQIRGFLDAAKAELAQLQEEREMEREVWQKAIRGYEEEMRKARVEAEEEAKRRDAVEREFQAKEVALAEERGSLEAEREGQRQALTHKHAELAAIKEERARAVSELVAYKLRAHALLQKRDAELAASKDAKVLAAQEEMMEEALREAKREVVAAVAAKEAARREMAEALNRSEVHIAAREVELAEAGQRFSELWAKYEACQAELKATQVEVEQRMNATVTMWQARVEQVERRMQQHQQEEQNRKRVAMGERIPAIMRSHAKLQAEYEGFREQAEKERVFSLRQVEALQKEVTLLKEAMALRKPTSPPPPQRLIIGRPDSQVLSNGSANDGPGSPTFVEPEEEILGLARLQAQREEQLTQTKREIEQLRQEIADLEKQSSLHAEQEAMLKEEFRSMERLKTREGVDMTYLKNVILKLLETGEVDALLPVIAMLLQFSPDEVRRAKDAYKASHLPTAKPQPTAILSFAGLRR